MLHNSSTLAHSDAAEEASTPSRKGADTQQVLASVVRTARQRKLDLPDLITTMLRAPTPIVPDLLALPPPS